MKYTVPPTKATRRTDAVALNMYDDSDKSVDIFRATYASHKSSTRLPKLMAIRRHR